MAERKPNTRPPRVAHPLNQPASGTYRTKRDGVWRPALVWSEPARDPETGAVIDRPPRLRCVIDGEEADLEQAWHSLHVIDEETYRLMAEERLDPEEVPDFGQERGHNSRDAELSAAADAALESAVQVDYNPRNAPQWFRRTALLVKQIIVCEHDLEAVYKALAKPLQEQLDALRKEHHSAAGDWKPALRAALTAFAEKHGIPACPECSAFWREREVVTIETPDAVPREFCSPDMGKIKAALKRGKTIAGVKVEYPKEVIVS